MKSHIFRVSSFSFKFTFNLNGLYKTTAINSQSNSQQQSFHHSFRPMFTSTTLAQKADQYI